MESRASSSRSTDTAALGPGVPAPYGRACTNCSKAKCRCVYRGSGVGSGACERCHRLAKTCVPSETVRKRTPRRQIVSRTAQLEEKLDDLVSLLKTQRQAKAGAVKEPAASTLESPVRSSQSPITAEKLLKGFRSQVPDRTAAPAITIPSPPSSNGAAESRKLGAGVASNALPEASPSSTVTATTSAVSEADECLEVFRTRFLRFFPFIHVPASTTAEQLERDRPLTMLAIKCVTSKSFLRQQELGDEVRRLIAQKAIVEHESSLDILQAILTYIGWGHFHKRDKPFLTPFSRLAISQVIELGLHRPFGELAFVQFWKDAKHQLPEHFGRRQLTNEERRVALGCYCLCAVASSTMKRTDPLRWTAFMEDMLRDLEKEPECEGDKVLVAHVKMHQIIEQMSNARTQTSDVSTVRLTSGETIIGTLDPCKSLPDYYISLLRARLRDLTASLPEGLQTHDAVEPMLYSLDLMITECGLNKPPKASSGQTAGIGQSYLATNPQQLDYLHNCVEIVERYFNRIFDIAPIYFHGYSFAVCTHVTHALITLFRLTVYEDPLWDRAALRRRIDLLELVDRTTARVLQVQKLASLENGPEGDPTKLGGHNVFMKSWSLLQRMRAGWEAELRKIEQPAAVQDGGGGCVGASSSSLLAPGISPSPPTGDPMMTSVDSQLSDQQQQEQHQQQQQLMLSAMELQQQQQQQPMAFGSYDPFTGVMLPLGLGGPVDQGWFSDVFYHWDYQNTGTGYY